MKKGFLIFCLLCSIGAFAQNKKIIPPNKKLVDTTPRYIPSSPRIKEEFPYYYVVFTDSLTKRNDTIPDFFKNDSISKLKSKRKL
jgi:hypothetical protein